MDTRREGAEQRGAARHERAPCFVRTHDRPLALAAGAGFIIRESGGRTARTRLPQQIDSRELALDQEHRVVFAGVFEGFVEKREPSHRRLCCSLARVW